MTGTAITAGTGIATIAAVTAVGVGAGNATAGGSPGTGSAGARDYVWIDSSPGGGIDSGDRFVITYDSDVNGCWYDDPYDNIDTLVYGTMEFNDFVDGSATSFGADVVFDDFVLMETEETGGGHMVLDDFELTTNGGFNLMATMSD